MQDGLAWSKDTLKPEHSGMTLWKRLIFDYHDIKQQDYDNKGGT